MANPQMWLTLALLAAAMVLYTTEWLPIEVVSAGLLAIMLVAFQVLPVAGPDGANLLSPDHLLAGFGNPALITVMALLVVAEALTRTGALDRLAERVVRLKLPAWPTIMACLLLVIAHGAVISDTSVVVMFLPVMQALASRLGIPSARVMLPLSFSSVLGGMLTLIGSSTNLMVASALIAVGEKPLGFFDQTPMALPLVAVGTIYILAVLPRLTPRRDEADRLGGGGKQFISHLVVPDGGPLAGEWAVAGAYRSLPGLTVHLLLRGGKQPSYAPYDDAPLAAGDVLIIAGPRKALADAAARFPGALAPPAEETEDTGAERGRARDPSEDELVMIEAMVPPASRFIGSTVVQAGLQRDTGLRVAGIERRARMMRRPMHDVLLQSGDILLLLGRWYEIDALRAEHDVVVIAGSVGHVPRYHHTGFATAVFLAAVTTSAAGVLPIAVAAFAAATLLVAGRCLTPRQAIRAIDHRVVLLVGSALALSHALQATGAAAAIARAMLTVLGTAAPLPALAAYFALVAAATNVLSHNACAVLFTPVGVGIARQLGLEPHLFAIATVLAANCSFATPIGHQVNLLVMGPGHYRFADYVRAGLPLVLLLWLVFVAAAKLEWGL